MPTFDFKCNSCNSTVEMRIVADTLDAPVCTTCQGTMTKVYTPPAIIFRGGGWGGQ